MRGHRTELWKHYEIDGIGLKGEKYYRCVHCGAIVESRARRLHLRYAHKEIWKEMLREENKDSRSAGITAPA